MAQAQRAVQSTISNITQNIINSPINHLEGLAGINRDGSFLNEIPANFQNKLQQELELALKLKSLAKFWRVQVSREKFIKKRKVKEESLTVFPIIDIFPLIVQLCRMPS